MITVKPYPPQTVEHFDPDGNSLGFLNEAENLDLSCQIAEHQSKGYYLVFDGAKIPISSNGKIETWNAGLYDINEILFARLFKAQRLESNKR